MFQLECRQVDRKIVRADGTVFETEDHRIMRPIRTDTVLKELLVNHLRSLEVLPDEQCQLVQQPAWFAHYFDQDLKLVEKNMKSDPGLHEILSLSLGEIHDLDPVIFEQQQVIQKKLLLRGMQAYEEYPQLHSIVDMKKELKLPPGIVVNREAKKSGMYIMDQADLRLKSESERVYIYCRFRIGANLLKPARLELNFLMSCRPYAQACREAYRTIMIKPLIKNTIRSFHKNYAQLHNSVSNLLPSSQANFKKMLPSPPPKI